MPGMDELAAKMKQKKLEEDAKREALESARNARISEWQGSINTLFDNIQKWMAPLAASNLAEFNRTSTSLTESVGDGYKVSYDVPVLAMKINGLAACIQPKGLYFSGTNGLIEFLARDKQYLFSRHSDNPDEWTLRSSSNRAGKGVLLNQESLAEAISHYL